MHNNKPTDLKNSYIAIQLDLQEDIFHQSSLAYSDKYNTLILWTSKQN